MVSNLIRQFTRYKTAVLLGTAAVLFAQKPEPAKFEVLEPPSNSRITKPQHTVTNRKGSTVVTIHAGQKPTGGYGVEITAVERAGATCTVRHRLQSPDPADIVTQALTYPAATVRITPACREIKTDPPLPRGPLK